MKLYEIQCKQCLEFFETNNKHRTRCLKCKEKYPTEASSKGMKPFVRKFGSIDNRNKELNKKGGKK